MKTTIEKIKNDPAYLENIRWGKPRPGHPEATVEAHIKELEENLERIRKLVDEESFDKLSLLAMVHDSFKKDSRSGVPIEHKDSHASLASSYLSGYCDDHDLINMVQYHDEPYALWRKHSRGRGSIEKRLLSLSGLIQDWDLFMQFNCVDNITPGKDCESLEWFLSLPEVKNRMIDSEKIDHMVNILKVFRDK